MLATERAAQFGAALMLSRPKNRGPGLPIGRLGPPEPSPTRDALPPAAWRSSRGATMCAVILSNQGRRRSYVKAMPRHRLRERFYLVLLSVDAGVDCLAHLVLR